MKLRGGGGVGVGRVRSMVKSSFSESVFTCVRLSLCSGFVLSIQSYSEQPKLLQPNFGMKVHHREPD